MKRSRSQFTNVLFALSLVALCVAVPAANAGTTTYDFSTGLQGWTQLYPALPTGDLLWQDYTWGGGGPGYMLSGGDWGEGPNTYFGRSPEFTLDASKEIAFQLIGAKTMIDTPVAPDAIPVAAIEGGGFVGVALRDVATNTYLMWTSRAGTGFVWQNNGFSAAALAPLVASAPAALYTLDYIDYDVTPGDGWVGLGNVNINVTPTPPTIWSGPAITFTKADYTDWTLAENQDRLTDNVWITRGNSQQIFNIAAEAAAGGWETDSPVDTEWAWPGQFGNSSDPADFKAANYAALNYGHFDLVNGGWVGGIVGVPGVVHLISDDIYIEVTFTSWTQGVDGVGQGGGFSYMRSTNAPDLIWSGGSSEWSTAAANWNGDADYFENGKSVLFDDTNTGSTTVDISGADVAPSKVIFSNTAAGLGTYTLQGTNGITGATGLTKSGDGTLIIENINTYEGGTTLYDGNLQIAALNSLGSGDIDFRGGTLQCNSTLDVSSRIPTVVVGQAAKIDTNGNDVEFGSAIDGAGGLGKLGYGTLTLAVANTYTGPTTIGDGGTLKLGHSLALQNSTLDYAAAGGPIDFGTLTAATLGGLTGDKDLVLENSEAVPAAVALTVGQSNADTEYGTTTTDEFGTIITGVLSGTGSLIKVGTGTLSLNTNDYQGGTTVKDGIIRFRAASLGTGNITFEGGTLQYRGHGTDISGRINPVASGQIAKIDTDGNDVQFNTGISGDGGLAKLGSGTLALNVANTYNGDTTIGGGTVQIGNAGSLGGGNIDFQGGTLRYATGLNTDISGKIPTIAVGQTAKIDTNGNDVQFGTGIGGEGGLTKLGDGKLTLAVANTYTGSTTVNAGTLDINTGTVADLQVHAGTVNIGSGVTANTAGLYAGTVNAGTNALAITDTLTTGGGTKMVYTGGTSFTASGANIRDDSVARTLTLSGGVLSLSSSGVSVADLPAGVTIWLDASNVDGFGNSTVTNGVAVETWVDNSGIGNNATQTEAARQPIFVATSDLNSQPALRFDGASDRMMLGDLSEQFPTAATFFAVIKPDNDTMYSAFGNRANDERWRGGTWDECTPGPFRTGHATYNPASNAPTEGVHVFAFESNSSEYHMAVDGLRSPNLGADYNSGSGQDWVIGTRIDTDNNAVFRGDIAEFIFFNTALTQEEMNIVGGYLATKYGITSSYTDNGEISVQHAINLPDTAITVTSSSTLATTVGLGINKLGNLTLMGGAELTLSGDTVSFASLTLDGAGASSIAAGGKISLRIGDVDVAADQSLTVGTPIVDGDTPTALTKLGDGTLTLIAKNTYTGDTTINGGTLSIANACLNAGVIIDYTTGGGVLNLTHGLADKIASLTVDGAPMDNGFYNVGDYDWLTGTTGGMLIVGLNGFWDGGSGTNTDWDDTLNWNGIPMGAGDVLLFRRAGGGGAILNNNVEDGSYASLEFENAAPAFTLEGNSVTLTGDLSGNIILNSSVNTQTVSMAITLGTDGAINAAAGDIVVDSVISGNHSLTKTGDSQLTLSGDNSYTGGTIIKAGTVVVGSDTALGETGGNLTMGGGSLDLGGTSQTIGALSVTAAAGTGDTISNGDITGTSYAISNPSGEAVISANLLANGAIGLTKSGAGTATLSGTNTYTGLTKIIAGTLKLGSPGALQANQDVTADGTLDIGGNSLTINALNGTATTGAVTNSNAAPALLTVSTGAFAGAINDGIGAVALDKVSSGTLTLSGASNYTGGTTVTNGTLNLASGSSAGSGTITLATDTALAPSGASFTISNPIVVPSGTATIKQIVAGAPRYVFSGGVTGGTSGAQTLSIIQGAGGGNCERTTITVSGSIQNGSGGILGVNADFQSASTTGQGAFICLSGLNTFTGPIVVSNTYGLLYNDGGNPYHGAWFVIGGEITSSFSDRTTIPGTGYLGGGNYTNTISLATGTILNYMSSATQTLGGVISGGGNIVKEGTGTLTLSGANTYTGTTTVSNGLLKIDSAGSIAAGAVTVSGGALSGTGTVGGAVTLSGAGGVKLMDGSVGTLALGSTLGITGAAGANNLSFDLGSDTTDKITVAGATTVDTAGAAVITLSQIGGAATPITAGTYTLIEGTGAMAAVEQFALATTKAFGQTFALGVSGSNLQVTTAIADAGPAGAFWNGTDINWTNVDNWNTTIDGMEGTGAIPGVGTNVTFSTTTPVAGNLTNTVDDDFEINSLTFDAAGGGVTIGGTKMLILDATNANGNVAGNGITSSSTGGNNTISTKVGLGGSQTWTVAAGRTLIVSGTISDLGTDSTLTKAGDGTLELRGIIGYSGETTIEAGTIYLHAADNAYANGAPIPMNVTIKSGARLVGERSFYVGTLTMSGGTWSEDNGWGGGWTGPVILDATSTIQGGFTQTINGNVSGPGGLIKTGGWAGGGTLALNGTNNTFEGGVTLRDGGTVAIINDKSLGTGTLQTGNAQSGTLNVTAVMSIANPIYLASGGNLTVTGSNAVLSGDISGDGTLTKGGGNTLTLTGTNTNTGETIVSGGKLLLAIDSGTGGAVSVNNQTDNTTASLGGTGVIAGAVSVGATSGTGRVNLITGGDVGTIGTLSIGGGLTFGAGAIGYFEITSDSDLDYLDVTGDLTADSGTIIRVSTGLASDIIYSLIGYTGSALSDIGNYVLQDLTGGLIPASYSLSYGTNSLDLVVAGNRLWTGNGADDNWQTAANWNVTPVSGGILHFASLTGTTIMPDNDFDAGTPFSGIVFDSGAESFTLGGSSIALGGNITNSSSKDQTINMPMALSRASIVDTGAANMALGGDISGVGSLTKAGTGTLTLSGTNTHGGTAINAGTLLIASDAALGGPAGALTLAGGTLKTTAGITSARPMNVAAAGGTFDTNTFDSAMSGALSGTGSLTKAGIGTLTLSGTGSLGKATTNVTGGKLVANADILAGPVALSNNTNVTFNQSSPGTYKKVISGEGSLTKTGTAILTLAGTHTYNGATAINGGTLKLLGTVETPGINGSYFDDATNYENLNLDNASYTVPEGRCLAGTQGLLGLTPTVSAPLYTGEISGFGMFAGVSGSAFSTGFSGTFTPQETGTHWFEWHDDDRGSMYIDLDNDGIFQSTERVGLLDWNSNASVDLTAGTAYTFIYMTADGGGGFNNDWYMRTPSLTTNVRPNASDPDQAGMWSIITFGAGDNILPTTTAVTMVSGTTFDLNGNNQQIASLADAGGGTGHRTVLLGTGTLTVGDTNTASYSGSISGDGGVTKVGSGEQILRGANTYKGDTIVQEGTLTIGNGVVSNLDDASTVEISVGAYMDLNFSGGDTIAGLYLGGDKQIVGIYGKNYLGSSYFDGDGWFIVDHQGDLQGDANEDGIVDSADYIALKQNFGKTNALWSQGDFDDNGTVDYADLQTLMAHFGETISITSATTPEPATLGLLAIGALALLRRRRLAA